MRRRALMGSVAVMEVLPIGSGMAWRFRLIIPIGIRLLITKYLI